MNAEAVVKIKEAEENASALTADAEKRSADMISQAKADALLQVESAQKAAEKLISDRCSAAQKAASKIESEAEGLAISESGILRRQASDKMDEAVHLIIWGIIGKWQ